MSRKNFFTALLLASCIYACFFYKLILPNNYFWESDAQKKHIPARYYLYEKIVEEKTFPFWSERVFLGFPIYADFENGYLHPLNIIFVILFGPLLSYKILHLTYYFLGSMCLYIFLKRKGGTLLGYAASNTIYFFSNFLLNHQIHFNLILSLYLLPCSFLLMDIFLEKRKIKFIFLQSLVLANSLLWGYPQAFLLMLFGIAVYSIFFKLKLKTFVTYFSFLAIFVFSLTFFQLLPTYNLYKESLRDDSFRYTQGSLTAPMVSFLGIPYFFGTFDNFIGKDIDKDFSYTEVYIYLGISTLLVFLIALFTFKKRKILNLSFIFFWLFLLLSFLTYELFLPDYIPIISLFRYWVRSVILVVFGISIAVGLYISALQKDKFKVSFKHLYKRLLFYIGLPVSYIIYLFYTGLASRTATEVNKMFPTLVKVYPYYLPIFLIIFSTLLFTILSIYFAAKKDILARSILAFLLVIIIATDLRFFASDVLETRIENIHSFKIPQIPQKLTDVRALTHDDLSHMENLYTSSWSPYGYSQFIGSRYYDFVKNSVGLRNERALAESDLSLPQLSDKMGIEYVYSIETDDLVKQGDTRSLDLLDSNSISGKYIYKKEGNILMEVGNPSDTDIETFIKFDENWKLLIDGNSENYSKNGIFIVFRLPKGHHSVLFKYIPHDLYFGLFVSATFGILSLLFIWLKKNYIYSLIRK